MLREQFVVRTLAQVVFLALILGGAASVRSQEPTAFRSSLGFEVAMQADGMPGGWRGGPADTISLDSAVVHTGKFAARLHRTPSSKWPISTLTKAIPIDFQGQAVEIRGFLRTKDVTGYAGLWLREDGARGQIAIDDMQSRQLKGTTEWVQYRVTLPLAKEANRLVFGVMLSGAGTVWGDDLEVVVDGRPVGEAQNGQKRGPSPR